jgi:hypothetical protein
MKQNLQFYRSKTTKVRGQTFTEKLNTIVNRCKKVYEDCKSALDEKRDLTIYRQEFGKEHKICYDLIDAAKTKNEALAIVDILYTVREESTSAGQREALGYIITELEVAIETSP